MFLKEWNELCFNRPTKILLSRRTVSHGVVTSEMGAIKCKRSPPDIGLHSDNLAIQQQCPNLAKNRI